MTIIYPVNGRNERMGSLFRNPKHLLLYKGTPAIIASTRYMSKLFPLARIIVLANKRYYDELLTLNIPGAVYEVLDTNSQIETLQHWTKEMKEGPVMFVDCDIVPVRINPPRGNTVYLFENKSWMKQYSNYTLDYNNTIINCNEKGMYLPYAGSGIYYFQDVNEFNKFSKCCTSISQVVSIMYMEIVNCGDFKGDFNCDIFRFGTLNDIKNEEQLADRIH